MNKNFIEEFDVRCYSCDTKITVSTNAVYEVMENSFDCPVCKENLTGNVHKAMKQIHTCNQEMQKLKVMLENNIVSVRLPNP